jgi:hypothetical protein
MDPVVTVAGKALYARHQERSPACLVAQPLAAVADRYLATMPHDALPAAWSVCERCKQELQTIHIKYRWAMASLGKAYASTIHEIKAQDAACTNDARNGDGRGKVISEVMDFLLQSVSTAGAPKQPQALKKRLHRAFRWYEAAKQLSWGMLCFMPHDVISNSWVENKLQVSFWRVWLELVTKMNPIACKASRALNA